MEAAARLLERETAGLVSWGCAAALAPHLEPGDLVLPQAVLGADGRRQAITAEWRDRLVRALSPALPVHSGTLLESARILPDRPAKQVLYARTGALAADMESAAIAHVAQSRGLPFLAVRAIADSAAMRLPEAVTAALGPRGDIAWAKLLGHCLRQPIQIIELARLGRAFGAAMATLRRVRALSGADCGFTSPCAGASPIQPIPR